jgi:hypothetical protein
MFNTRILITLVFVARSVTAYCTRGAFLNPF